METQGRVAVITGGASGIGKSMARAFAADGMKLVLADLDEPMLAETVKELEAAGAEAVGTMCDVASHEDVQALAQTALDRFGAVHVLCNNAGVGIPTATHKIKMEDWHWIMNVDLWGPIHGVDVFLPIMEEQGEGHINTTSSFAGLIAGGYMAAYNVAKHGAVALMATLERDLRGRKSPVHASVLCPGPINTNISRHSVQFRPSGQKPKADGAKEGKAGANIQSILERAMHPDEAGAMVLDAIRNDTFWVLTHPKYIAPLRAQIDAMENDRSLPKA